MSGAWPTSPVPRAVQIQSYEPALVSVSQSLRRYVRSRGGQRWMVKLQYSRMLRADWEPLQIFAQVQHGQYEKFTWTIPLAQLGTMAGTPLVNGVHAVGDDTIATDGYTPGAANVFKSGAYIKFANHAKVYRVYGDVTANGSGQATLTIQPALAVALSDNEAITHSSVPMQVALVSDVAGFRVGPGSILEDQPFFEFLEDPF